jgi:hypothetical protein
MFSASSVLALQRTGNPRLLATALSAAFSKTLEIHREALAERGFQLKQPIFLSTAELRIMNSSQFSGRTTTKPFSPLLHLRLTKSKKWNKKVQKKC